MCDRTYATLDFDAMRARAVTHGMEEPHADGFTVLRMCAALEELYEYFLSRTDWAALGKIFNRAKIPFTVNERTSTDRYLDPKTGLFTFTFSGLNHSGDFSFGTVGGVAIGTATGDLTNVASDVHPTQQVVEAARAFMDDRWARRDVLEAAAFAAALQVRRNDGRVTGNAKTGITIVSGELQSAGATEFAPRYVPTN